MMGEVLGRGSTYVMGAIVVSLKSKITLKTCKPLIYRGNLMGETYYFGEPWRSEERATKFR